MSLTDDISTCSDRLEGVGSPCYLLSGSRLVERASRPSERRWPHRLPRRARADGVHTSAFCSGLVSKYRPSTWASASRPFPPAENEVVAAVEALVAGGELVAHECRQHVGIEQDHGSEKSAPCAGWPRSSAKSCSTPSPRNRDAIVDPSRTGPAGPARTAARRISRTSSSVERPWARALRWSASFTSSSSWRTQELCHTPVIA